MKTNIFSKVAVTMMTVALGAGIVGSISGTVAWFQYSTRSTVAYTGTSAHCTENLQIRIYDTGKTDEQNPWKSDLTTDQIKAALKGATAEYVKADVASDGSVAFDKEAFLTKVAHGGTYTFKYVGAKWTLNGAEVANPTQYGLTISGSALVEGDRIVVKSNVFDTLKPVTSGELKKEVVADTFYRNPIYQYSSQESWETADATDYVTIPLELRVLDVDGEDTVHTLAKKIYVSGMDMAAKEIDGKKDISSALRVGVEVWNGSTFVDYGTFAKDNAEVITHGYLDLNNQDGEDTFGDFSWEKGGKVDYGYQFTDGNVTAVSSNAGLTLDAKKDWILAKLGTAAATKTFTYDGATDNRWEDGGAAVNLAEYGVKITAGTPADGDTITLTVVAEDATTHPNKAESFNLTPVASNIVGIADDTDPYNIKGKEIGSTTSAATLRVQLKIYLEGWKQLGGSAIWSAKDYVGAGFNVGVRFSAEAHSDH